MGNRNSLAIRGMSGENPEMLQSLGEGLLCQNCGNHTSPTKKASLQGFSVTMGSRERAFFFADEQQERLLVLRFTMFCGLLLSGSVLMAQDGFQKLFNGKDLTGWTGDSSLWKVEDGCITGTTTGPDHLPYNKFLIWDGTASDFEFRCEFRLEGQNNSGVQYRSVHDKERGEFVVAGYQADIHGNPEYTGMLYDEKGRGILAKRGQKVVISREGKKTATPLDTKVTPVDVTEWHELTIIANGNRLIHKVDGVVSVDVTDRQTAEAETSGVIALQVHRGPAMKVQFRNLMLKPLVKTTKAVSKNAPPAADDAIRAPKATSIDSLKVAKGFEVELLYSVPKDTQGSWVNMCVDPKGRLIVSDQYGELYRVTPPGIQGATELSVEKIDVPIGEAQGLLWAFDSLYVSVNKGQKYEGGLYRVRDTDADDKLDSVEMLRALQGTGEHGPHAVLPHPDGKSLVIVCGNRTELTEIDNSLVPSWDEDLLVPRVQGKFMRGTRAPGGVIYKIDPDGKTWEVLASGFRNQFDAAFDTNGELFTYDADMEWDINTPWYRPTRICHVVSGAEFGWRSGGGKWPAYYADSVPAVVNVGPGSPTGVCFGLGAKFPAKYQKALFACDWSYGKLYAVHLEPEGGTFTGKLEEFITGIPLPLTDVVINPHDGAMYFAIGGRKVQSGLYRVTHTEASAAEPVESDAPTSLAETRRQLESMHRGGGDVNKIWPHLGSDQRAIRYAARIALEHIPRDQWQDKALTESDAQTRVTALLALARTYERQDKGTEPDIDTPIPNWGSVDVAADRAAATRRIVESVQNMDLSRLTSDQKLELLRALTVTFVRIAPPNAEDRKAIIQHLHDALPAPTQALNSELAQLITYVQAPYAVEQIVRLLEAAPTQEEQIEYARNLRLLKTGWTPALQERFFKWFTLAAGYEGGSSFQLFVTNIKAEAVANLSEADKARLQPILDAKPKTDSPVFTATPREFVKEWTMEELVPLLETGLQNRDFDHGRQMFGAAACFACHRFDSLGGSVGPDLTVLSGRFSPRDILESVLEPSKQISDQYGSVQIVTTDGKVISGRIVNLAGDSFRVQTDMLKPGTLTNVDRNKIEEIVESKVSMMPKGLLNTLDKNEVLDLMAYLLSRGDRNHPMFAR